VIEIPIQGWVSCQKVMIISQKEWDKKESIDLLLSPILSRLGIVQSIAWPSNLKKLNIQKYLLRDEQDLASLFSQEYPPLESFSLHNSGIPVKEIEFIIHKSNWINLKSLSVSWNRIQDEGIEILVSRTWPLLEYLNLYTTNITAKGIECIINKSNWINLKKLGISWNQIQDKGIEILASGKWPQLEILDLQQTNITAKGIEFIINKSNWINLKSLDVSRNKIQDEGIAILASGKWPYLEDLDLASTDITAKGIECIINKANWINLKSLDVSWNQIKDEGIEKLASGKWPRLEDLSLLLAGITAKGIELIAKKANWINLKKLGISWNQIQDEGIEILVSGKWPLLQDLDLRDIKITSKGLECLISKSNWPKLKSLNVSENKIRDQTLKELAMEKWHSFKNENS